MHIRCPHCQNPIEVVEDAALRDLVCPSCGSSFNLLPDETVSRQTAAAKTLGRFQLVDRIGIGAFGEVWTAYDGELDRTVAVKIPRKEQLTAEETEAFLREARSAAQLHHPSIVAIHEVGKENDQLFIVSDFVKGVTLADWLSAKRPTAREAAELCAKIADAVQHAHEHGVIHRDLKPSNIMLDDDGQPHIMDFGLAKREAGEITMTIEGKILGTPAYMSPEQAQGAAHAADERSDVYSLGVILFELLTGDLPFRGNARMLIHQVINDEPPSPRKLNNRIPTDLNTICLKCLEKNPDRRYQQAATVSREIRKHLAGRPIEARPVSRLERGRRWCRRNPLAATLSSTVFVLLLLVAAVGYFSAYREAEHRKVVEENLREIRKSHYSYATMLAFKAWETGDVQRLGKSLGACIPIHGEKDFRGIEWRWLWTRLQERNKGGTQIDCGAPVADVAWSRDNYHVAVVLKDGGVMLCDVRSEHRVPIVEVESSQSDAGPSPALALSSGDDLLAAITTLGDGTTWRLFLWRIDNGKPLQIEGFPIPIDLDSVPTSVAISRNGDFVAVGQESGPIWLYDRGTNQRKEIALERPMRTAVAFSPHADILVSFHQSQGLIMLWDPSTLAKIAHLKRESKVRSMAFHPRKNMLVTSTDTGMVSWDLSVEKPVASEEVFKTFGQGRLSFCGSGRFLAVGQTVWDVERQKKHAQYLRTVLDLSPDGKWAAFRGLGTKLQLVDLSLQRRFFRGDKDVFLGLAASPDGRFIVTGGEQAYAFLLDVQTGETIRLAGPPAGVHSTVFSSDGKLLFMGGPTPDVAVFHRGSTEPLKTFDRETTIYDIAVGSDDRLLAAVGGTRSEPTIPKLFLWDTETWEEIFSHCLVDPMTRLTAVAFSPNGRLMACGGGDFGRGEKVLMLWDVSATPPNSPQLLKEWKDPKIPCHVLDITFSPNNKLMCSGGDSTLIWNLETYMQTRLGTGSVSVAFSPDSSRVITSSIGAIRFWRCDDGAQVGEFSPSPHAHQIALFPNGDGMVVAGRDGVVEWWRIDQEMPRNSEVISRRGDG